MQEIRTLAPGIGAYKLFLILRDIYEGKLMRRDRFYRLLRRKGLMLPALKRRHTTNSNHNYRMYKNRIKGYKPPTLQLLWVADITYIETDDGICYLHLLTDAFTHEIVGWTLSESLVAENTLQALNQAITMFPEADFTRLTHHSDRGAQYCCNRYVDRLKEMNISISMTEDGNPTDNAIAERVNGIIKQEWLYREKRPGNIVEARIRIARIIDFYNNIRPHRSNNMKTPKEMRVSTAA